MKKNILVTGGAGFIGSHLIRLLVNKYPNYNIFNIDALTYAGNLENLKDIENKENYLFIKANICDLKKLKQIFSKHDITHVVHLAAESHVDRSIENPFSFANTNIIGTLNLLQTAKEFWKDNYKEKLFYHISTDEVYGSLGKSGHFTEKSPYDPHSPYSASKASSDHFVRAFSDTYGLPTVISNCSNNYGPYQFPEKLIPLFIKNILKGELLPVYGNGNNIRDWLFVEDHANAIDLILHKGKISETYNIGGSNELRNIDLIRFLIKYVDEIAGNKPGYSEKLITYVEDRSGHDFRYAIDSSKLIKNLGWMPNTKFEDGIKKTIVWYYENNKWIENIDNGEYINYYKNNYDNN